MKAGTKVRIKGLVKASRHNGKSGTIVKAAAPGEGRLGVRLEDGTVLAIKIDNLECVRDDGAAAAAAAKPTTSSGPASNDKVPKERTLKRDNALLREFGGSPDPNVLALYYHFSDRAFDSFNAPEYNEQMIRYYENDITVRIVIPRKIGPNDYFLVGLQHSQHDKNTLCEVAFQCGRSFEGISMLVKRRCFACNKSNAPTCKGCLCACFCSEACAKSDIGMEHKRLCSLVEVSKIVMENDCVQLL